MSEGKVVGVVQKNERNRIVVEVRVYNDKPYLDIRTQFLPDGESEWVPTKKGITAGKKVLEELLGVLTGVEW